MLSILTNFGCHFACSYCIYKKNGINIPTTKAFAPNNFNWKALEEELKKHRGELISVSGGGDPLFNYGKGYNNEYFYDDLFALLDKYNCTLELHTSILTENFPYHKCERVVFHLAMPTQISLINNRLFKLPKYVRVVYVVQSHYTEGLIRLIKSYVDDENNAVNELSFRQMVSENGQVEHYCHDFLKKRHKKDWYYIEQADYNEYFVNDHIEKEYLKIK